MTRRMIDNDLRSLDLELRFFAPTTVAILGASETEGSPGAGMMRLLLRWAEHVGGAPSHMVNPKRDTIAGLPCYANMDDVPVPVDLCAVLVSDVLPAVERPCGTNRAT